MVVLDAGIGIRAAAEDAARDRANKPLITDLRSEQLSCC